MNDPMSGNEADVGVKAPMPAVTIRNLFALAKGHSREFVGVSILGLISSGLTLAQPALVSSLLGGDFSAKILAEKTSILGAILVIGGGVTGFQYYLLQRVGEGVVFTTRQNLIRHMLRLPIREFDHRDSGDLLSRVSGDSSRLRVALIQGTVAFTGGIFLVLGSAVGMAIVNIYLFVATLIAVCVALGVIVLLSRLVQRSSFYAQREMGLLSDIIGRDLRAIRTIRAGNATEYEEQRAVERARGVLKWGLQFARLQAFITPLSNVGLQACVLVVLGLGGYRVARGYMSLADLVTFALLLYIMVGPITQISSAFSEIGESLGSLARIREIMDIVPEGEADVRPIVASNHVGDAGGGGVVFEEVSFGYERVGFGELELEREDLLVLRGVSLNAKAGQRTAIVGPSGAGKSTVLQLIERFYEPVDGQIYVNGREFRQYAREELRELICYVEQDAPAVSGSLRENLTLGGRDSNDEECISALEAVNLRHLVDGVPEGLERQVGEGGSMLSGGGGGRQRLALARCLLSPADIILLDESTSNLDGMNEAIVRNAIDALRGSKTVIAVAHRLATVIDADVIYVLEHGRVVGSGSHEQLLATVPLYRTLAREQFIGA